MARRVLVFASVVLFAAPLFAADVDINPLTTR